MKKPGRVICLSLIVLTLLQTGILLPVSAASVYGQAAVPSKLRVEAIHNTQPNDVQPAVGYNEFDKYYADLKWDAVGDPNPSPSGISKYMNVYLQEINKPYKPVKPAVLKEENLSANTGSSTEKRLKELQSGTIYYAYAKSYYTYNENNTTYTSSESQQSNNVKFMTDIDISAMSYGPNQIKIEWDDVWNSGRRMDYKLYISENSTFNNAQPIYIGQEQIGSDKPVKVNEASGKLEYIHTVRDPGRVYYIKVVPDTTETELKRSAESPTVIVSSFILAQTTKMSTTDFGTIWRLQWSPVVTGLGNNAKVTYYIYKGVTGSGTLEQYLAAVSDTTFFLTLQPGEENNYYLIKAVVTVDGEDMYPGIKIQSDKIYIKESPTPAQPGVPELVNEFLNAGSLVISYFDELKPRAATVLWRTPKKGNGEVDSDVVYDIWLVSDPNQIDEPPVSTKIADSIKMGNGNMVLTGTTQSLLLGYKYALSDLTPNSTYYFKIVAKKFFTVFENNVLTTMEYKSMPALKVIITPPEGAIDQPVTPGRPPLALKKTPTPDSRDVVTASSAIITLKNKWYEEFETQPDQSVKWVYRTPQQIEAIRQGLAADLDTGSPTLSAFEKLHYRKVEYDNGVTFDVGLVKFTEGMDYSKLEKLPTNKVVGFSSTPNDPLEDPTNTVTNPDGKKHNVDIEINTLEPNTTYIVWLRAARRSVDLISGPSDPIIITTNPELPNILEKPTVPVFNYYEAADTYVNLGWNIKPGYNYYIKYATVDNPDSAKEVIKITPQELLYSSYYKLAELSPNTLYYFWIQAEASNSAGDTLKSEWSDSLTLKTLPDIPPATPKGFGVKGTEEAVTKDSITYEWVMESGLEYILEIASDIDYKDVKEYKIKDVSEYKITGLRSNYRYVARLYAYDPAKKLKSEPTQSVIVRTKRSNDDYDSDQDVENVISGDYIVKDTVAFNHIWKIRIIGVNADRFVEHMQTDTVLDYRIDLSTPPTGTEKISFVVAGKVFNALDKLKENIIVETPANTLVVRPGMLSGTKDFELLIVLNPVTSGTNTGNLTFKTAVTGLEVSELQGGNTVGISSFGSPLKVVYSYNTATWYKEGYTSGSTLPKGSSTWQKAAAVSSFDPDNLKGYMSFELQKPGSMAAAEASKDYFDDISGSWARSSINNVSSKHRLKSVLGNSFQPAKQSTLGDTVKFMLDVLDYSYGADYMNSGVKAGLISSAEVQNQSTGCTREKAIAMAVRLYELKTTEKAAAQGDGASGFKDISQVSTTLLPKIKFAAESGIITYRFSDTLGPKDVVTRAEIMVLLEKLLTYTGEL